MQCHHVRASWRSCEFVAASSSGVGAAAGIGTQVHGVRTHALRSELGITIMPTRSAARRAIVLTSWCVGYVTLVCWWRTCTAAGVSTATWVIDQVVGLAHKHTQQLLCCYEQPRRLQWIRGC
jgi:hypothetical protein